MLFSVDIIVYILYIILKCKNNNNNFVYFMDETVINCESYVWNNLDQMGLCF